MLSKSQNSKGFSGYPTFKFSLVVLTVIVLTKNKDLHLKLESFYFRNSSKKGCLFFLIVYVNKTASFSLFNIRISSLSNRDYRKLNCLTSGSKGVGKFIFNSSDF